MKLDKTSKRILRFACQLPNEELFSIPLSKEWEESGDCSFQSFLSGANLKEEEVRPAIKFLEENGYVEYATLDSPAGEVEVGFSLTHKGIHYKEFNRLEMLDFLIKSIFVPIAVSVITAGIVTFASYLWTMSGISTQNASQTPISEPIIEETNVTRIS